MTEDPDISSPAWMELDAKNIGTLTATQNFTGVDFTIGKVRIQVCSDCIFNKTVLSLSMSI